MQTLKAQLPWRSRCAGRVGEGKGGVITCTASVCDTDPFCGFFLGRPRLFGAAVDGPAGSGDDLAAAVICVICGLAADRATERTGRKPCMPCVKGACVLSREASK